MANEKFVKITEEMVYSEEKQLPLCEWVRWYYECTRSNNTLCLDMVLVDCESPIEQVLSLEMEVARLIEFQNFTSGEINVGPIERQADVQANGHKYRVDFLIPVAYHTASVNRQMHYVIECDGHDYHEKTKAQVLKNNKRNRDLQSAGYEVVRFSGSEIYKSSHRCVEELMRIIYNNGKIQGG